MKRIFSCFIVSLFLFTLFAYTSENFADAGKTEKTELQRQMAAEFKEDHKNIFEALEPGLNEHNRNFIAALINKSLLEQPFEKKKADRVTMARSIVGELVEMGALNLPEDVKIKLFLEKLVERIPGSGFLSREEDKKMAEELADNKNLLFFDYEKIPGIVYVDLNFCGELESYYRFRDNFSAMVKSGVSERFIFDLRGCSNGSMREAAKIAELFYGLEYKTSPKESYRGWKRFIVPPRLMYNEFQRPFDCLGNTQYITTQLISVVNPLAKRMEENHLGEVYFETGVVDVNGNAVMYSYINVKNEELNDFEESVKNFNDLIGSHKIVIMVDEETAGPAELFTALMVHNNPNVVVFGEPTKGEVSSGTVYTLVYDKVTKRMDTLENHKKSHGRKRGGSESGESGETRVAYREANSDNHNMTDIGTLKLPSNYWENEFFNDYRIKNIHEGGITPHYLYDLLDNTPEARLQAAIELLK